MTEIEVESKLLYFNDVSTKLGKVTTLGIIKNGVGTDRGVPRVYGSYAIVYFLEGTGLYDDANGFRHTIVPGDLVLVTPELPHRYATRPGRYWTECHLIFEGPAFDMCLAEGLLTPARPVRHLEPIPHWFARMQSVVTEPTSPSRIDKAAEVARLLALLSEIFEEDDGASSGRGTWLTEAKTRLDANLETEIVPKDVARDLGVSYETFRKGFQKQFGVSPGLYRTRRRIEVACRLLTLTTMTHQRIADYLGFSDEFHFSKRFKQVAGIGPREYRRRNGA